MKLESYPSRRTGPAQVRSCGCDVLPWEPCRCTKPEQPKAYLAAPANFAAPEIEPWDAHLSLDRVIERAQLDMTQYPDEPYSEPARPSERPALDVRDLLKRCRLVASWYERGRGKRGKIVRPLIAEIDAFLRGSPT